LNYSFIFMYHLTKMTTLPVQCTNTCAGINSSSSSSSSDALGGLVVCVLATEPTGYSVAGSSPTEDGGFLRVIKIHSTHFLRRGSKAVGPMS
jgi:hypothetical protein